MARKLPWATSGLSQAPRGRIEDVSSTIQKQTSTKRHVARPSTPETTPRKVRDGLTVRSPSTSPIRPPVEPISSIEPMRPGLDADDIYMMVEDEFEATARQFTAHLHAAEYARLKRKAREAPSKALPELSSEMSHGTRQNLERKRLLSRQSTTLSRLGAGRGVMDGDSRSDEEEQQSENIQPSGDGDENVARELDLWSGTSLAGLMDGTVGTKTSLIGLERLNSTTRAARGYGQGDTESTPKRKKKTVTNVYADTNKNQGSGQMGRAGRESAGSSPVATTTALPAKSTSDPREIKTSPGGFRRGININRRSRIQNFDEFDDSDDSSDNDGSHQGGSTAYVKPATSSTKAVAGATSESATSRSSLFLPSTPNKSRLKRELDQCDDIVITRKKDRKGTTGDRSGEVPVFLV